MSSHFEGLVIAALVSGCVIDAAVAKGFMHELLGIDGGTDALAPVINAQVFKFAAHREFAHKIKFQIMINAYEHLASLRSFGVVTPRIRHD
jgi:hypothetical protein